MSIATTILQQLGGNKFLAMTGSKQLVDMGNGLKMKLTRNKVGAQYLIITLNGDDLYKVEFKKVKKSKGDFTVVNVAEFEGVYCDMLQRIFTETTGLYTKL